MDIRLSKLPLNGTPERSAWLIERACRLLRAGSLRDSSAAAVLQSFRDTLTFALSSQELAWVDAIEQVRAVNNRSVDRLVRIDYGAGDPNGSRTAAQMSTGVEVVEIHGEVCQKVSKPLFWCILLFMLVRRFRPQSCVEMGTAFGISAAYQRAALALNGSGSLVTLEGAESLAEIARRNFNSLEFEGLDVVVGRFADTLEPVLRRMRPVDFVFVDGHHDERATCGYFEQIIPYLAERALLVFDDIAWSKGMERAWRLIAADPRVVASIDLGPLGLCIIDRPARKRRDYTLGFSVEERAWVARFRRGARMTEDAGQAL